MTRFCPYVVRATLVPDFTLPDGTVIEGPGQYLSFRESVDAPTQIIQRDKMGSEQMVSPLTPETLSYATIRILQELEVGIVLNYGRNMTQGERARIEVKQGWKL